MLFQFFTVHLHFFQNSINFNIFLPLSDSALGSGLNLNSIDSIDVSKSIISCFTSLLLSFMTFTTLSLLTFISISAFSICTFSTFGCFGGVSFFSFFFSFSTFGFGFLFLGDFGFCCFFFDGSTSSSLSLLKRAYNRILYNQGVKWIV